MGRSWESQAVTAIGIGRPSPFCMNPEAMANTSALGELPEMASEGPRTCLGDLELSLVQARMRAGARLGLRGAVTAQHPGP